MANRQEPVFAGDELVKRELITQADLDEAKKREQESGTPWYRQLLQLGKVNFGVLETYLRYEIHPKSEQEKNHGIGKSLMEMGIISNEQLEGALQEQAKSGKLLGDILKNQGLVDDNTITRALARRYGIEFSDMDSTPSFQSALDSIPETAAKKYDILPIEIEGDRLTVLVTEPLEPSKLQDASVNLGKRIHQMLTSTKNLKAEIGERYNGKNVVRERGPAPRGPNESEPDVQTEIVEFRTKMPDTPRNAMTETDIDIPELRRFEDIARQASGVPVVKLVTTIIEGAVHSAATDIHLDPQEPEMRVRYRIDGTLHDVMAIPSDIEAAVVSRVKIMADLDITETRHPQDGHISMDVGEQEFDVRVATLPTFLGERVVLRLLDQSSVLAGIKDLGLEPDDEKKLTRVIAQPYGMVLVTGPTGSGKTTTLYASLNQKDVLTDSIVTLEDPVEYQLSGINQVQIDTDIGLTFANTLRASLRQDIDVLLVGEIRDPETARIAIRAAMTGHLVLSTLHTNDAIEAISTLRNMDIPSYLISNALTAVIAQRLVRKICDKCKTSFAAPKTLVKSIGLPESTKRLYRAKGCDLCYRTGTRGRTGIFEIIEVTPEVRRLIASDASAERIAKASKIKSLAERCRIKVKKGIVTPEEYLRVIRQ